MEATMTLQSVRRLVLLATFTLAAVAAVLPYALFGPHAWNSFVNPFVMLTIGVLYAAYVAALTGAHVDDGPMWIAGVAGLASGVLANVAYDSVFLHIEHNLFPIEIVMTLVLATPGVLAGFGIASVVLWHRRLMVQQ